MRATNVIWIFLFTVVLSTVLKESREKLIAKLNQEGNAKRRSIRIKPAPVYKERRITSLLNPNVQTKLIMEKRRKSRYVKPLLYKVLQPSVNLDKALRQRNAEVLSSLMKNVQMQMDLVKSRNTRSILLFLFTCIKNDGIHENISTVRCVSVIENSQVPFARLYEIIGRGKSKKIKSAFHVLQTSFAGKTRDNSESIELIDLELQNQILGKLGKTKKRDLQWPDIALISIIAQQYQLPYSTEYVNKKLILPKILSREDFEELLSKPAFSSFVETLKTIGKVEIETK